MVFSREDLGTNLQTDPFLSPEINLAKNRNGPVERVRLAYMPNFTKFADLSRAGEPESIAQKPVSNIEPGNF